MSDEIKNIQKTLDEVTKNLEANKGEFASKEQLAKVEDAIKHLDKRNDDAMLRGVKDDFFGDKSVAKAMSDYIEGVVSKSPTGLDSATATRGTEFIPSAVASRIDMLLKQGGLLRSEATVISGLRGSLDLPFVSDEVSVASKVDTNDVEFNEVRNTGGVVTLDPQLVGALYRSSLKLMRESSVTISSLVTEQLVNAARVYEDTAGIDVIKDAAIHKTVASEMDLEDLLDLIDEGVHESIDPSNAKYYVNRKQWVAIKKTVKNDEDYNFVIDLEQGGYSISGVPLQLWQRLSNFGTGVGKIVVLYGNLKQAVTVGVGQDYKIDVTQNESKAFKTGGLIWRLMYDFDVVVNQPGAVGAITAASGS